MHIAYISPAWPPAGAANGIVTYVSVIRDYLLGQGHDVSVLADGRIHFSDGNSRALEPADGSTTFLSRLAGRFDRRLGHHPFTGRRMAGQLRAARRLVPIDLIEMEESFGWCRAVQQRLDVPVVTRLHGPQFLKPEGSDASVSRRFANDRERAEGRAISHAAALSAPTRFILQATRHHYLRPRLGGHVIPNPVAAVAREDRWRADMCDQDMILCVGRLDRLKGADTIVAAFADVLAARPTARLVMVGPEGRIEQADGTMAPFIEHARRTLAPGVLARITFAGLLAPEAIRAMRRRAFLTVVASRCENFPYAAVEAMAAGGPLIATAWLGSSEVVDDGVTGWVTPVGDAARMAERIRWVFDHREEAAAAGDAAWRKCHDNYTTERVGAKMLDFYGGVIDRWQAAR